MFRIQTTEQTTGFQTARRFSPPIWTGSSWRGMVILNALPGQCIEDLAIGGQELCIDDVRAEEPRTPCLEDANGDGMAGFADVLALVAVRGPCAGCPEDLDGNRTVGLADILAIIAAWGPC